MALSPIEKVDKLKACDELMFNLNSESDKEQTILKVGKLLGEIGLLEDTSDKEAIISAYKENVYTRLQNYLSDKNSKRVIFNDQILTDFENSSDEDIAELAQDCRENFIKYSGIVLSFNEALNALKSTKRNEDYRLEAQQLDHRRTQIHNACLNDIGMINRLAENEKNEAFVDAEVELNNQNRTHYGAAIIKLCYNKMMNELNSLV